MPAAIKAAAAAARVFVHTTNVNIAHLFHDKVDAVLKQAVKHLEADLPGNAEIREIQADLAKMEFRVSETGTVLGVHHAGHRPAGGDHTGSVGVLRFGVGDTFYAAIIPTKKGKSKATTAHPDSDYEKLAAEIEKKSRLTLRYNKGSVSKTKQADASLYLCLLPLDGASKPIAAPCRRATPITKSQSLGIVSFGEYDSVPSSSPVRRSLKHQPVISLSSSTTGLPPHLLKSSAARSKTAVVQAFYGTYDIGSRPSTESNTTEGTGDEFEEHGLIRRDAYGRPVVYRDTSRCADQNAGIVVPKITTLLPTSPMSTTPPPHVSNVLVGDERSRTTASSHIQLDGTEEVCYSSSVFKSVLALEIDGDDADWTEGIIRFETPAAAAFSRHSPPPTQRLNPRTSVPRFALLQQHHWTAKGFKVPRTISSVKKQMNKRADVLDFSESRDLGSLCSHSWQLPLQKFLSATPEL
ncbi:hypothetical protein M436DRAFT_67768 [Aureobasidium namibiae CBS 147.97]|uniref:Uncharacterized protein n=1 Tax=Aureobasidium namibiae CBS 147.97 TaxID=1043004 RepID=A0A074X2H7_9PEZI